jgi:FkbH-like protein
MLHGEKIRLVIWDLDETFWRGTLSEGGIREYVVAHHEIVVELAARGIVSSICSKNDPEAVEAVLKDQGLWGYFVFPSIDWTAKGPRLKQLIEDIQLRPETALFIDDNASNRAEAATHVPGLQTCSDAIIGHLLADELLKGKPDPGLTRLKQYRMLQQRKSDERSAGADNGAFLRASHIKVVVDPDIAANLDRAIELINRTNQLNFTKARLPDERMVAEQELLTLTRRYNNQAGLIRVWDDYGDHGFCGFYVVSTIVGSHDKELLHFCFSCRILGMGVEQWLYERLGRPKIEIHGDVSSELDGRERIDWINSDLGGSLVFAEGYANSLPPSFAAQSQTVLAPEIRVRGSCELTAIAHYLQQETPALVQLTSYRKGAFFVTRNETTNLGLFASGLNDEVKHEIDAFGLFPEDYDQCLFEAVSPGTPFVLATWGDAYLPVYRHARLGFEISMAAIWGGLQQRSDLTDTAIPDRVGGVRNSDDDLSHFFSLYVLTPEQQAQITRITRHLRENYIYGGPIGQDAQSRNLSAILNRIPANSPVAILLPPIPSNKARSAVQTYHATAGEVVQRFPNAFVLDPSPYIASPADQQDSPDHLDRMVYFNIYKELVDRIGRQLAPG